MKYEKKPTMPRSHGNMLHTKERVGAKTELGTRLAWSRDRQAEQSGWDITERGERCTLRQERAVGLSPSGHGKN